MIDGNIVNQTVKIERFDKGVAIVSDCNNNMATRITTVYLPIRLGIEFTIEVEEFFIVPTRGNKRYVRPFVRFNSCLSFEDTEPVATSLGLYRAIRQKFQP